MPRCPAPIEKVTPPASASSVPISRSTLPVLGLRALKFHRLCPRPPRRAPRDLKSSRRDSSRSPHPAIPEDDGAFRLDAIARRPRSAGVRRPAGRCTVRVSVIEREPFKIVQFDRSGFALRQRDTPSPTIACGCIGEQRPHPRPGIRVIGRPASNSSDGQRVASCKRGNRWRTGAEGSARSASVARFEGGAQRGLAVGRHGDLPHGRIGVAPLTRLTFGLDARVAPQARLAAA